MAIAVDPDKVVPYVLIEDRKLPVEQQTRFLCKFLSAREDAQIQDNVVRGNTDEKSMQVKSGSTVLETLRKGLRGWENFKDQNGNDVPWRENNGTPRDENFNHLKPHWRREIANFITEQNTLKAEEIKNLESGQESEK